MTSSTMSLIVSFTYLIGGVADTIRFASVLSTKCNFATPSSSDVATSSELVKNGLNKALLRDLEFGKNRQKNFLKGSGIQIVDSYRIWINDS